MTKLGDISNKRIGVVVDSHLDDLPSFNARSRSLPNGSSLPKGFELIYGSADVGKDHVAPLLISRCDRAASRFMVWLHNRKVDHTIIPKKDHLFFWRPEGKRLLPLPDEPIT